MKNGKLTDEERRGNKRGALRGGINVSVFILGGGGNAKKQKTGIYSRTQIKEPLRNRR